MPSDHICQEPGCGMKMEFLDSLEYPLLTDIRCPRNDDAHALCARVAELEDQNNPQECGHPKSDFLGGDIGCVICHKDGLIESAWAEATALKSDNAALRAQVEDSKMDTAICKAAIKGLERAIAMVEKERNALLREKAEREAPCPWQKWHHPEGGNWFIAGCYGHKMYQDLRKFCDCGHPVEVKG